MKVSAAILLTYSLISTSTEAKRQRNRFENKLIPDQWRSPEYKSLTTKNNQGRQLQENSIQGNCTGDKIPDCTQTNKCISSSWVQDDFCDDGTSSQFNYADSRCYDRYSNGTVFRIEDGQEGQPDGGDCGGIECNTHDTQSFSGQLDLSTVNGSTCDHLDWTFTNATAYQNAFYKYGEDKICNNTKCFSQVNDDIKNTYNVKDVRAVNGPWLLSVPVENNAIIPVIKTEGDYEIYSDNGEKIYSKKNKTTLIPITSIKNIPGVNVTFLNDTYVDFKYFSFPECIVSNEIPTNGNEIISQTNSDGTTLLLFGNNFMFTMPTGDRLIINGTSTANITIYTESNFQSLSVNDECLENDGQCNLNNTEVFCGGGEYTYELDVKFQDVNKSEIFNKQCPFFYCLSNDELNFINVSIYDSYGDGMNSNEVTIGSEVSITFEEGNYHNEIIRGGSLSPTPVPTLIPTFSPTFTPTFIPTPVPTLIPTFSPTFTPTFIPTPVPTPITTPKPSQRIAEPPSSTPTTYTHWYLSPTGQPTNLSKGVSDEPKNDEKEGEQIGLSIGSVFIFFGVFTACYCIYKKYWGYTRTQLNETESLNPINSNHLENFSTSMDSDSEDCFDDIPLKTTDDGDGGVSMTNLRNNESVHLNHGDDTPNQYAAGGDENMKKDEIVTIDLNNPDNNV